MSKANNSVEVLSDVIVHMKYARYIDELQRRETWSEIVNRNKEMHKRKYPHIASTIESTYNNFVLTKKILPSMRSMQFAGKAIEQNHARIYNCAYLPVDDYHAFSEALFLLLGGTGVGYSVQYRHVGKLPCVQPRSKSPVMKFVIEDSIEGWADAVKALMKGYLETGNRYEFDYSKIREKGTRLVTAGGRAPGAAPLKACIEKIAVIMEGIDNGAKMSTLQAHDVMCHLADAVLAGGIRRAALISLFSKGDDAMLTCKSGSWWEDNPQRGRANNSMTLHRTEVTRDEFFAIWKSVEDSRSGEPGFYWNNNMDWGTNPCCLDGDTIVQTDKGDLKLVDVLSRINDGEHISVLSFDENSGVVEMREIEAAKKMRENADVIKIECENGAELILTPDHRVYTENRGYVEAAHLTDEDVLLYVE